MTGSWGCEDAAKCGRGNTLIRDNAEGWRSRTRAGQHKHDNKGAGRLGTREIRDLATSMQPHSSARSKASGMGRGTETEK